MHLDTRHLEDNNVSTISLFPYLHYASRLANVCKIEGNNQKIHLGLTQISRNRLEYFVQLLTRASKIAILKV